MLYQTIMLFVRQEAHNSLNFHNIDETPGGIGLGGRFSTGLYAGPRFAITVRCFGMT